MTPARLSDETLREIAEGTGGWQSDMARELLTLRARVADTPENVERVAQVIAREVARVFNSPSVDGFASMLPVARAALAALADPA